MKVRIVILLSVLALLLPTAMVLAAGGTGPPVWYAVEPGTASGGSYSLATLAWQASGTASGGGYRLLAPVRATGRGTPCCCGYVPCILRNYQR